MEIEAMADNQAKDDEEEGFGNFKSASNYTVRFTPNPVNGLNISFAISVKNSSMNNGEDEDDDEDDWGDFLNSSSVLSRTESLPNPPSFMQPKPSDPLGFFMDPIRTHSMERTQPGSGPGRIESGKKNQAIWVKPQGALPLSIFGEGEGDAEERSGAVDPPFNGVTDFLFAKNNNNHDNESVKKESGLVAGVGFNDLITNLYKQREDGKPEYGLKQASNGSNLDMNACNWSKMRESVYSNGKHSDWNGSSLDTNVMNLGAMEANLNSSRLKVESDGLISSRNTSNLDANGAKLNFNPLNLDTNGADLSRNLSNSYAPDQVNFYANGLNGGSVHQNENFDDEEDGWEFMAAESKTTPGDERIKNGDWKTENGPTSDSNVSNFSWNILISDLSGMNSNIIVVNSDASQLNSNLVGASEDFGDDDGWEFKGAEFEKQEVNGNTKVYPGDLFATSDGISLKSGGWDFELDFNSNSVTQDGRTYSQSNQNKTKIWLNSSSVHGNISSDENLWHFNDESSGTELRNKDEPKVPKDSLVGVEASFFVGNTLRNEPRVEKLKGPLPLSVFGDNELEKDEPLFDQDFSSSEHGMTLGQKSKSPSSDISINDLISTLYIQAGEKASVNSTAKPSENGYGSTQSVINFQFSDDDYFDEDSWEFKDAFSGNGIEKQNSFPSIGELDKNHASNVELNNFVDFYSKLKDELYHIALTHLDTLKKGRSTVAHSGEDTEVKMLDKEIQDLQNQLLQDRLTPEVISSENLPKRNISVNEIAQILLEPKFKVFESEYHLSKRLLLAEKDLRITVELLKHAGLTLKMLKLASLEEQSNYVSTWSRIVSACAQELKHGALIWNQALQKNVHSQLLCKNEGKKYLLALGEIYRVLQILGSSARLYKPWILLSSSDPAIMLALLNECSILWSSSGLEEALQSISDLSLFEYDGTVNALLESIKHVGNLDALALYNCASSDQERTCQLSGLTMGTIPGMKMVVWNGNHYFLTLANLWANLVSPDPPILPHIHVH